MSRGLVSAQIDFREIHRYYKNAEKIHPKAGAFVLNRAAKKVRSAVVRDVSGKANIKPMKVIGKRTRIRKATWRSLYSMVRVLVDPINAISLSGARQTKRGAAVRGRSWPGAFISTGKNKYGKNIYKRRGRSRYPINVIKIEARDEIEQSLANHVDTGTRYIVDNYAREFFRRMKRVTR